MFSGGGNVTVKVVLDVVVPEPLTAMSSAQYSLPPMRPVNPTDTLWNVSSLKLSVTAL